MGENSKIEWTDHTFNPWWGCTPVSSACDFCYAEALSKRFGKDLWGNKPRQRTSAQNWNQPRKWNRQAEKLGIRYRVFCASMADVFDNQVPTEWRDDLWQLIRETPHLDWLLLTKRPQNISKMLPPDWGDSYPNVWLGMTIENQSELDRRASRLFSVRAKIHFFSMEPLLGPVGLMKWLPVLDWVICGGESGSNARPMHPDWARSLRDQCQVAGVAFHFKQWGEYMPGCTDLIDLAQSNRFLQPDGEDRTGLPINRHDEDTAHLIRIGKKKAGRLLDGRTWDEFPAAA